VNRPLGQAAHGEVEPAAVLCPAAHFLQAAVEVEPVSGLNVPDSQATHAEPVKAEKRPLEQVTHEEGEVEPVAAACPAAQAVHAPRLPAATA
jgi:hypothetical protein